jgi:hypothetical protein
MNSTPRCGRAGFSRHLSLERRRVSALEESRGKGLAGKRETVSWRIPYTEWGILYDLRRVGVVRAEKHGDSEAIVTCELSPKTLLGSATGSAGRCDGRRVEQEEYHVTTISLDGRGSCRPLTRKEIVVVD